MTDNLFHKLEEKVTLLLSELDSMRKEISLLRQENSALKLEKVHHTQKLQELISLLDILDPVQENASINVRETALLQGEKEQVAVA